MTSGEPRRSSGLLLRIIRVSASRPTTVFDTFAAVTLLDPHVTGQDRSRGTPPPDHRGVLRLGVFELDRQAGELRKRGVKVHIQEKPLRILELLLEHPGEVVTREAFREQLWPGDVFVDFDHSLNAAVSKLRDALGDLAASPLFIETLPRGYRLIAPV